MVNSKHLQKKLNTIQTSRSSQFMRNLVSTPGQDEVVEARGRGESQKAPWGFDTAATATKARKVQTQATRRRSCSSCATAGIPVPSERGVEVTVEGQEVESEWHALWDGAPAVFPIPWP